MSRSLPLAKALDDVLVCLYQNGERVRPSNGYPLRQWVCRWPSAIAQYTVGHDGRRSEITRLAAAHRGLHLCGTAYDGVSFNDAIASARRAARAIASELAA